MSEHLDRLGKTPGLETVAEGIEESTQYSRLKRGQCVSGRGYLCARPLGTDDVEEFLTAGQLKRIA